VHAHAIFDELSKQRGMLSQKVESVCKA